MPGAGTCIQAHTTYTLPSAELEARATSLMTFGFSGWPVSCSVLVLTCFTEIKYHHQCNESHTAAVTRSYFLLRRISCATALTTFCGGRMWTALAPYRILMTGCRDIRCNHTKKAQLPPRDCTMGLLTSSMPDVNVCPMFTISQHAVKSFKWVVLVYGLQQYTKHWWSSKTPKMVSWQNISPNKNSRTLSRHFLYFWSIL